MKKEKIIIYIVLFIFTLIIFSNMITMHYATDTYNIINMGYEKYALRNSLNDGRVFMSVISILAGFINMPIEVYVISLTIIAISVSVLSVMKIADFVLKNYKGKNSKAKYIILIMSYVVIFNFLFLENMQFAECAVMAISILLDIIAAKILVEKEKKYIIKSMLIFIISVFCYQGTVNWFITITFFFSIIRGDKFKDTIINTLISGIEIVLGIGLNLLQVRLTGPILNMTATRMGNLNNIVRNFEYIWKRIFYILADNAGLFPRYIFLVLSCICSFSSLFLLKKQRQTYLVLLLIIIAICASFAPHLITLASVGAGRMYYSIGAVLGLVLLYIFVNLKEKKYANNIIVIISIIYFVISIFTYINIMKEHKLVNEQDKKDAIEIGKYIEEYEKNTGTEVKYICFITNNSSHVFYNNIQNMSALTYRSLFTEWSRIGIINYFNNRNFEEITAPNEETKRFENKSWEKLDREQLYFTGPILYLCIY